MLKPTFGGLAGRMKKAPIISRSLFGLDVRCEIGDVASAEHHAEKRGKHGRLHIVPRLCMNYFSLIHWGLN